MISTSPKKTEILNFSRNTSWTLRFLTLDRASQNRPQPTVPPCNPKEVFKPGNPQMTHRYCMKNDQFNPIKTGIIFCPLSDRGGGGGSPPP